jgi:glycosyltransferase involved in cell wall biosynthesis
VKIDMKIASIGMQVRGGAGLSSLKLHTEFLKLGHESKFFVAHHTIHQNLVEKIVTKKKNKGNWWELGTLPLKDGVENVFTSGLAGTNTGHLNNIFEWADVILLRWVTATVSDLQISQWSLGKKPLFWCLSDMAPFTGGCHYSRGCTKYELDCKDCHMTDSNFSSYPSTVVKRREALWKDIHVVSPSKWLAECSLNSRVFRNKEISVIPTGVELDVFLPTERLVAKTELDLPLDKIILCFGADSVIDDRKGYVLLLEALNKLAQISGNADLFHLIIIGNGEVEEAMFPFSYTHFGNVNNRETLAKIYSSADITVLPYKEDNLPNVMLESLSCGTPVVAFNIGGIPDILDERINGQLVLPYDTHDFAIKILKQIDSKVSQSSIRLWAETNISVTKQAKSYLAKFNEVLKRKE